MTLQSDLPPWMPRAHIADDRGHRVVMPSNDHDEHEREGHHDGHHADAAESSRSENEVSASALASASATAIGAMAVQAEAIHNQDGDHDDAVQWIPAPEIFSLRPRVHKLTLDNDSDHLQHSSIANGDNSNALSTVDIGNNNNNYSSISRSNESSGDDDDDDEDNDDNQ